MPDQPLVSVVVPSFNRARLLAPTIDSILMQDYPRVECIVMDGGSIDGTAEVLRGYGDRIRWVSEPDKGPADAINKGWAMSRGDILAWLNADDLWATPQTVSHATAYLQAHPDVDIVYGDAGTVDLDGNLIGVTYLRMWDLTYAVVNCDHCIPQPAAFMRRRILERVGWLDDSLILMDQDLWYRAGLVGVIHHLPLLLAQTRSHASYWHSRSPIVAENCARIIDRFFANPELPDRYPALYRMQRRARSNAHLRGVDFAWMGGRRWGTMLTRLAWAVRVDPANAPGALRRLVGYIQLAVKENPRLRPLLTPYEMGRRAWHAIRSALTPVDPALALAALRSPRDMERAWATLHMPAGPGAALELGPRGAYLGLAAARRGFCVTAVDEEPVAWPYDHPGIAFVRGDVRALPLAEALYDLVINCGALARLEDDLEIMARLRRLLKTGGVMLLTAPLGQDVHLPPHGRVYGAERLARLLAGFTVERADYWIKQGREGWKPCGQETALQADIAPRSRDAVRRAYGLGCFILRKQN